MEADDLAVKIIDSDINKNGQTSYAGTEGIELDALERVRN
jgi:hypothetical protein